jgi:hypothetical protein
MDLITFLKLSFEPLNQLWLSSSPSKLMVNDLSPEFVRFSSLSLFNRNPFVTMPQGNPFLYNSNPILSRSFLKSGSPPVKTIIVLLGLTIVFI